MPAGTQFVGGGVVPPRNSKFDSFFEVHTPTKSNQAKKPTQLQPNVGKYTIHAAYGISIKFKIPVFSDHAIVLGIYI